MLAFSDPFLGDGHHGTRIVSATEDFTRAAPLALELPADGDTLSLSGDPGFSAGDLLLLHRTTTDSLAAPARDAGAFDLEQTDLGRFELVRVLSADGGFLTIDRGTRNVFPASGSQAVLVHEFTDLTVTDGGRIVARPWDGSSGGIVAILARGVVRIDGSIDVSGAGSRGGAPIIDTAGNAPETFGCSGEDEPSPRGAFKGESFFSSYFGPNASGMGRAINGGGGGVCHNSGGGGGGHAGAGGQGGASWSADGDRDVGGRGGMAIIASPARLTFGGGGGAGEAHHGSVNNGGSRGGGIIFMRAQSIAGGGALLSEGITNPDVDDAAGGGGAGGTVHIASATTIECGGISAHGGSGGINPCQCEGTSGGGGGGRAVLQADSQNCPVDVSSGLGGHFSTGMGVFEFRKSKPDFGTQALYAGEFTVIDGGLRPPPTGITPTILPRQYVVGCGCSGAPPEFAAWLLLALRRAKRRPRG